jgi:molecular chaperone GrpE (heat shock protein)
MAEKTMEFYTQENETLKNFVKEANDKLAKAEEKLTIYADFIAVEDFEAVEESLNSLVAYSNLGTVESLTEIKQELEAKTEALAKFEEIGTFEEIEKAVEALEGYAKIGSLESLQKEAEEKLEAAKAETLESLAKEFNTTVESAERVLSLHSGSVEEAKEFFSSFSVAANPVEETKEGLGLEVIAEEDEKTPASVTESKLKTFLKSF